MLRKALLMIAGAILTVLGLVGLVLPIIPGLLLLAGAAACFSLASRDFAIALERRMQRHPRYRRTLRRWHASAGLPAWQRLQLAFWLAVRSTLPERRGS
jgi:uncharacterized membrane protein YbaN (DUF454 family)